MHIKIDRLKPVSFKEQLVLKLETMIRSGQIHAGNKLPSIRQLAAANRISRYPVTEAYDHLVSQGLIEPRHGAGFYVACHANGHAHRMGSLEPTKAQEESWQVLRQFNAPGSAPPLSSGFVPEAWRDVDGIAQTIRKISRTDVASLIDYATPLGDNILRTQIARRLANFEVAASSDHILVTHSASQALDLVTRLMLQPGDLVFVEDPGYFNLFGLLKLLGISLVGIPRRRNGPDVDVMQKMLRIHRPKLFFLNTVFHNPTATNVSPDVAFRILGLAHQHDFLIVEDDVFADLQSTPTQRLATLDQLERVIYIGGFSKTLSSSFRLGYVAANTKLISKLVDVKMLTSMGGTKFAESVVASLLKQGTYNRHMETLRQRMGTALCRAVGQLRGSGWDIYEEPRGGMFVWTRIPHIQDSQRIVEHATKFDVHLVPGANHRPNNEVCPWLRFNVGYMGAGRTQAFLESAAALPS
ncbi:PLP-dependent aminotransferase family protein [Pusillimonas sp. SM2304]|uniref:aminotransferase-like domain-containing protein n=1 Tax=Pusillimonas sp. SM2304 TaxID=3073241 RepID=UPI002876008B|nr:PLP-dependent aminotransferase family protein [Pusillimonas sp. SM2304]MDS1142457.1 PLP-dependent aminotransferase family protein [Pusillimonas sp. SM2304]